MRAAEAALDGWQLPPPQPPTAQERYQAEVERMRLDPHYGRARPSTPEAAHGRAARASPPTAAAGIADGEGARGKGDLGQATRRDDTWHAGYTPGIRRGNDGMPLQALGIVHQLDDTWTGIRYRSRADMTADPELNLLTCNTNFLELSVATPVLLEHNLCTASGAPNIPAVQEWARNNFALGPEGGRMAVGAVIFEAAQPTSGKGKGKGTSQQAWMRIYLLFASQKSLQFHLLLHLSRVVQGRAVHGLRFHRPDGGFDQHDARASLHCRPWDRTYLADALADGRRERSYWVTLDQSICYQAANSYHSLGDLRYDGPLIERMLESAREDAHNGLNSAERHQWQLNQAPTRGHVMPEGHQVRWVCNVDEPNLGLLQLLGFDPATARSMVNTNQWSTLAARDSLRTPMASAHVPLAHVMAASVQGAATIDPSDEIMRDGTTLEEERGLTPHASLVAMARASANEAPSVMHQLVYDVMLAGHEDNKWLTEQMLHLATPVGAQHNFGAFHHFFAGRPDTACAVPPFYNLWIDRMRAQTDGWAMGGRAPPVKMPTIPGYDGLRMEAIITQRSDHWYAALCAMDAMTPVPVFIQYTTHGLLSVLTPITSHAPIDGPSGQPPTHRTVQGVYNCSQFYNIGPMQVASSFLVSANEYEPALTRRWWLAPEEALALQDMGQYLAPRVGRPDPRLWQVLPITDPRGLVFRHQRLTEWVGAPMGYSCTFEWPEGLQPDDHLFIPPGRFSGLVYGWRGRAPRYEDVTLTIEFTLANPATMIVGKRHRDGRRGPASGVIESFLVEKLLRFGDLDVLDKDIGTCYQRRGLNASAFAPPGGGGGGGGSSYVPPPLLLGVRSQWRGMRAPRCAGQPGAALPRRMRRGRQQLQVRRRWTRRQLRTEHLGTTWLWQAWGHQSRARRRMMMLRVGTRQSLL